MKDCISPVTLPRSVLALRMPSQYTSSVHTFFIKAKAASRSLCCMGWTVRTMSLLASTGIEP